MAPVEPKAKRPRRSAQYQMELKFPTDDAKASFLQRLSSQVGWVYWKHYFALQQGTASLSSSR